MKSGPLFDTVQRINWYYGRGELREIQVSACGAMRASIIKQYGAETPKVTIKPNGFVLFRGMTRKIRSHP